MKDDLKLTDLPPDFFPARLAVQIDRWFGRVQPAQTLYVAGPPMRIFIRPSAHGDGGVGGWWQEFSVEADEFGNLAGREWRLVDMGFRAGEFAERRRHPRRDQDVV